MVASRLPAVAVAAAALALTASVAAAAAAADPLANLGADLPGFKVPKKKRSTPRTAAAPVVDEGPTIPAAAGSGPILAPNSYLQFPGRVQPRSMAWAARRRAVLLTDGAIYKKEVPGLLPLRLLSKWEPVPQAYVVDGATGNTTYTMQFTSRRTPALPYGIAEDPRDGRVAVTFYQAQSDSIEVWQPDLSWKYTYHDVSLKPSIPFFYGPGGELWVPFTVADRFLEETDRVLQLYVYRKDGQREETFPRREWARIKYPHTVRVDAAGRVWSAGLQVWPWDDGVHGPVEKALNESMTPPVWIEVYGLTNDPSPRSPYTKEQRERWFEQNPGVQPTREMLASTNTRFALMPMGGFPFPLLCQWPLFDLTGDGHIIVGCYDQPELIVYRAHRHGGAPPAGQQRQPDAGVELLPALEEVARFLRPFGIEGLGAIAMDPSGRSFGLLDRARGRVYSAAWPLEASEEALRGTGEAGAAGVTGKPVTGVRYVDEEGGVVTGGEL